MTDVNEEYARAIGESASSTEGMTPAQRAEAYEAEAAQLLDKVTKRGYWSGEVSPEAAKFVELIVQAAVERIEAAREARAAAEVMSSQAYQGCNKTWTIGRGDHGETITGQCILDLGHEGKCQLRSASGIPYVMPGEVDNEPNPETLRAQAADRVEFNSGIHTSDYEKPPRQYITDGTGWREPADGLPED